MLLRCHALVSYGFDFNVVFPQSQQGGYGYSNAGTGGTYSGQEPPATYQPPAPGSGHSNHSPNAHGSHSQQYYPPPTSQPPYGGGQQYPPPGAYPQGQPSAQYHSPQYPSQGHPTYGAPPTDHRPPYGYGGHGGHGYPQQQYGSGNAGSFGANPRY